LLNTRVDCILFHGRHRACDVGGRARWQEGALDQEVRKFALKCAIAGFTFVATIILSTHFVGMMIEFRVIEINEIAIAQVISTIKHQSSNVGSRLIDTMDRVLAEQADPQNNNLPPEKKERMLKNLKIVSDKWRPLAQQVTAP
jgi:hypothetical protein